MVSVLIRIRTFFYESMIRIWIRIQNLSLSRIMQKLQTDLYGRSDHVLLTKVMRIICPDLDPNPGICLLAGLRKTIWTDIYGMSWTYWACAKGVPLNLYGFGVDSDHWSGSGVESRINVLAGFSKKLWMDISEIVWTDWSSTFHADLMTNQITDPDLGQNPEFFF